MSGFLTKFSQASLIEESGTWFVSMVFFKFSSLDITLNSWIYIYVLFKNLSAVVKLTLPLFKLQISVPSLLLGFPSHPFFEYSPNILSLSKHLLHVSVFVPELINSRQVFACPFPHISCMVDELVPHFHLCVLEPRLNMFKVYINGPLKN